MNICGRAIFILWIILDRILQSVADRRRWVFLERPPLGLTTAGKSDLVQPIAVVRELIRPAAYRMSDDNGRGR